MAWMIEDREEGGAWTGVFCDLSRVGAGHTLDRFWQLRQLGTPPSNRKRKPAALD